MEKGVRGNQKEKMQETRIANANQEKENDSQFKVIELEAKLLDSKKIPDMIGVRRVKNEMIKSYIEYKCTKYAMCGKGSLKYHFDAMVVFFEKNSSIKEKNEILFLFSHINCEDGITAKKVFNALNEIIKKRDELGKEINVSFCIVDNERGYISNHEIQPLNLENILKIMEFQRPTASF